MPAHLPPPAAPLAPAAQAALSRVRLPLPDGFRPQDVLAFHGRDPEALSERVSAQSLDKGLVWQGELACLSVRFLPGTGPGEVEAGLDARVAACAEAPGLLTRTVQRMLGLSQDVAAFEHAHRHHPQLGPLLAKQSGLRVPATATPFEALSWAITGQQISVRAAVAIRRRMVQACGLRHPCGLFCHPDAAQVLALGEAGLRGAGLTASKARTLLTLSDAFLAGDVPLADGSQPLRAEDAERIARHLLALKGIGPWTVSYALLRGWGWTDGALHGDVAVRRALAELPDHPLPTPVTPEAAQAWLAPLSPWRALAAAHLWASLSMNA